MSKHDVIILGEPSPNGNFAIDRATNTWSMATVTQDETQSVPVDVEPDEPDGCFRGLIMFVALAVMVTTITLAGCSGTASASTGQDGYATFCAVTMLEEAGE